MECLFDETYNFHSRLLPNRSELEEANKKLFPFAGKDLTVPRPLLGWMLIVGIAVLIFILSHHPQENIQGAKGGTNGIQNKLIYFALGGAAIGFVIILSSTAYMNSVLASLEHKVGLFPKQAEIGWCSRGICKRKGDSFHGIKWRRYVGYLETPNTFLLLIEQKKAVVIPKRGFQGPDEIAAFRAVVEGAYSSANLEQRP